MPQPRQQIKPRRHRHGKASRARGGLIIIFALLRLVDVFFLIALTSGPSSLAVVTVILIGIWTTALLIAIWRRQQWARIVTIALFILCTVTAMVLIPSSSQNLPLLTAYAVAGLVTVGTSTWLIYSRDIRRLTSRERE